MKGGSTQPVLPSGDRSLAIHVWGPVMIVPYLGIETTLQAIDLVGTNTEARDVSVIVLDLCGIWIDSAFGQMAIARFEEASARSGLELLLTGVSEPSMATLSGGGSSHQIFPDVHHAIAAAVQIARIQQQLL